MFFCPICKLYYLKEHKLLHIEKKLKVGGIVDDINGPQIFDIGNTVEKYVK